jgi:hypothetical protein
MSLQSSSARGVLRGSFSRMFQGCSTATTAKISERSSGPWTNSGMAYRGELLTLNTLEHPSDAVASTLSQVVAQSAPLKYFLSPVQIRKWLARASAKGISLPTDLRRVLVRQASIRFNMLQSADPQKLDRKLRGSGMTTKRTRSTREEVPTLFARRLLPSECEQLQGFPKNWTATDIEL